MIFLLSITLNPFCVFAFSVLFLFSIRLLKIQINDRKTSFCKSSPCRIRELEKPISIRRNEGTLKTPSPICRLYWSFLLGCWSNFVGSESGQKQSVKLLQTMIYNTSQREGRGAPVQYTSIDPSSMGATVHKLGQKFQPWVNVSPVYCIKSVKHNSAKSVNRSILWKSRH